MEKTEENITLKSISEETLYDHADKSTGVSDKCIFARWLKPENVDELKFVSKDVLLIRVGKTIIFYDIGTKKEDILIVGSKSFQNSSDAKHELPLEGIGCVDCCDIDLLALAEQPPISKVVICSYPELKVLATLIDNSCSAAYKSILFLKLEYLIGLREYPAFDLIVWAWRIGEKLLVVDTGFIQPNQYLNLSAITTNGRNEVYLCQTELDVGCMLQLWTLYMACKTIYAEKTQVKVPLNTTGSGCWTPHGWYVFCDSSANVYRVQPDTPEPEIVVKTAEDPILVKRDNGDNLPPALVCPTKQGFVLYVVNQSCQLTCFKDNRGIFTKIWTIFVDYTLQCIVAMENNVYGWSNEGTLIKLNQEKQNIMKVYGSKIKHFTFIRPTNETVATINDKNILQVWDVLTGDFRSKMKLNGTATFLCSNPFYNYICITFKNGIMEFLRIDPKIYEMDWITKIVLCDEDLSSVKFFSDGNTCCVTSFPTGRFFYISIKLGQTCSVIKEHHLEKYVIDIDLIDLTKSSFLTVLYTNQKNVENAGNNIIIFDLNFNVIFKLKDTQYYYISVFKWSSCNVPDAINVAFSVLLSNVIHLMTINIIKEEVLHLQTIPLDRQLRNIKTHVWENHCIIFSPNGSYSLYEFDDDGQWKKIIMVNCSNWFLGLKSVEIDVNICNILTLNDQGLMCNSFKDTFNDIKRLDKIKAPMIVDNFETKGIGYENELESPKRMTWLMINKQNELNESKIAYSKQKNKIVQDFEKIKSELLHLFEKNINRPDYMQINIEEFDLNVDYTLNFRKKCKLERTNYEEKNLSDIDNFKIETEKIIKEKWESLLIKPKSIYSLKNLYKVDNYIISTIDQEITKKANSVIEERILNRNLSDQTSPEALIFEDNFDILDVESNSELNHDNAISIISSLSYKFVETISVLNSQCSYYKLEMAEDEICLLKFMVNKLKHKFNELFDDLFIEKQQQLDNLKEYQDRLRVIEIELRLACKVESVGPLPVNYTWNKYEQTEKLLYVNDDEVPVEPYQSSSNDMLTNEEKNNKLLTLDNFKQQALMIMMDGVLEKRWEDELKKDVPKPQCMLNKIPEEYTADDLKAINGYEKLTLILNDERIKYKNSLEEEKIKIYHHIEKIIIEFDNNVFTLFQMKLKYNSAINQEHLKMLRLSKMLSDSDQRKRKIKQYKEIISKSKETIVEIEKIVVETNKKIAITEPTSLLNMIEILNHKNNNLNKRFKSEFPSNFKYKQALVIYNRRPKMHGNQNHSSLLGYQFVDSIMDPTDNKLNILTTEFVQYLDTLDMYDDYNYVIKNDLKMSIATWQKVCNFRRMKIECEFNINTCQKHATDIDYLLESLNNNKKYKEKMIEELKTSIIRLENQYLNYKDNPEIQLVIKQGNVETVLTGNFGDFENTSLISKNTLDEVNTEIKEMGNSKIEAVSNLLRFKCRHRLLEWEYEMLNHKTQLYTFRYDFIKSIKITENMLYYFKFKIKGINITEQAEQNLVKELSAIKFTYLKKKENLNLKLNDLYKIASKTKIRNKKADEDIDQMKLELNELKWNINFSLNDKLIHHSGEKMKNIVKFSNINVKVKKLLKDIAILKIELELLLLKGFPTK